MPRLKPTLLIGALSLFLLPGCRQAETRESTPAQAAASPTPSAETSRGPVAWKTVEEFDYSWAAQPPIHFKLELPKDYDDPGDFTRLRIQAPGQQEFILDNQDGWVEYDNSEEPSPVYTRLHQKNLVRSAYVMLLPGSTRRDNPPLVFLRSWGYASNAERLHVIGFQAGGRPTLLFNDELVLVEFRDLDGDGYPEIVGWPCLAEGFGADLVTYAPFRVYKIPRSASGSAVISLSLSESYNRQHYYGWAGPNCSDKLVVVLHPPSGGKPIIMSSEAAEKLTENADQK